ncbi:MAG: DUF2779 domain-containing protein [Verrucomicrobiia bacterium]
MSGLQCPKLLWNVYNAKHLIPEPDAQTQAIFDQGHEVGQLAKKLFPGGIEIGGDVYDFDRILSQSKRALKQRRPLYEAAFTFNGGFARADILNPVSHDSWDLIEVKSTTELKDIHLHDIAFQAFVLTGAGLKIRRCILAHINSSFVKNGVIDPHKFFVLEDVTDQVSGLSRRIEPKLDEMFGTIRYRVCPDVQIGPHCSDPYVCPLHDHCWSFLPENAVTTLYRGGKKGFRLLNDGITAITNIPDDFKLTDNQEIQRRTAKTGQPHVDKPAIKAFLKKLQYPISYLDFETFAVPIPMFDRVRPYTQIPFQFSMHVVPSPGAEPEHFKFLAEGIHDPRPEFMRNLRDALPTEGSVVAYNAGFELGRLKKCCDLMPEFRPWVSNVKRRIVDLLLPFRGFRYYHPKQAGSASMKAVLPALTGTGYDHLAIQDGTTASLQFLRATFGNVSVEERANIRKQLDDYCHLDTFGMIHIVDALRRFGS